MPKRNHLIILSEDECRHLQDITHNGKTHSAKEILYANILLLTAENCSKGKMGIQEVANIF